MKKMRELSNEYGADLYSQGRIKSGKIITKAQSGQSYHQYGLEFTIDGNEKITGKGDAYKIFATVIAIIRDFVESKEGKVELLSFSAERDSAVDNPKVEKENESTNA